MGGRKYAKDGDQGRLQISEEHLTLIHQKTEKPGQKHALEEPTQRLQQSQGSGLPTSELLIEKQETKPGSPMPQEGQQTSDDGVRNKPSQNSDDQSQNVQLVQISEDQQSRLQNKAIDPYDHSQLQVTDAPKAHKRQIPHSQSTGNAIARARDPSPKKGSVRSRMAKVFRGNIYLSSHQKKAASNPRRLAKGSSDGKRSENSSRDEKKLPPDTPASLSTQSRIDYLQPKPRTSQGRSEALSTIQERSQQTQATSQRESGPSRIEGGDNYGSKRTTASKSNEDLDNHAWERHLLQSADDATIQNEVLTLFEFIEHHVDDYYTDAHVKISQPIVDQLSKVQSPYFPIEASLTDLLEIARYPAPIIKHCLINLLVSGMSFRESALFPLLPDEFTVLPLAIRKEIVDTREQLYHDQAFSKLRSICAFLRPSVQQDPEYIMKLDETICRAVGLCSNAFAPWEARDSAPHKRHEHLVSLFYKAARVGLLLFSQPSTFIFDWTPLQKAGSEVAIQVWPRLLRTTNQNAEPLSTPQVIVEGSAQHIGVEIKTSRPILQDPEVYPGRMARVSKDIYDSHSINRQDSHFIRSPQPYTFSGPSEPPAPQCFVSATVQGPHNPSYPCSAPTHSEKRDQDLGYRDVQGPQPPTNPYSAQKRSEQLYQDPEYHDVHSMTMAPQNRASNKETYIANMQGRWSPVFEKASS